ncbi:MAG: preprotein translocase subunit YajC [Clostridiales Family XIII bacterium]|jgi:preprotein translocase subunit YajC|nr:preprotein translocase subunit YajC [Clostridiales Family XIII bacterium]
MSNLTTLLPLVLLIVIMYFMLIRPQKKREREVTNMRNAIKGGEEVITIGGICGKIVKAKDEVLTIQVGADRTKFEVMCWAISKVVGDAPAPKPVKAAKAEESSDAKEEETRSAAAVAEAAVEEPKPTLPKRLKKKTAEEEAGIEE